ncbi:hypothetical protein NIES4073_20580 [Kalymmatonema gypsitolerans NIES-4073]|nr:hypothetical protein NIES4073_20580 [Scytonema sp. NIES-4073]
MPKGTLRERPQPRLPLGASPYGVRSLAIAVLALARAKEAGSLRGNLKNPYQQLLGTVGNVNSQ